jgi:hypothetical protein
VPSIEALEDQLSAALCEQLDYDPARVIVEQGLPR